MTIKQLYFDIETINILSYKCNGYSAFVESPKKERNTYFILTLPNSGYKIVHLNCKFVFYKDSCVRIIYSIHDLLLGWLGEKYRKF